MCMAIRMGSIVFNCDDLEQMTEFWTAALGLTAGPIGDHGTFRVLGGDRVNLSLQVAEQPVSARDQAHLDLYTDDQQAEVARLQELGASVIRHHDDPEDDYVVMTDPEGNEFCVCDVGADAM